MKARVGTSKNKKINQMNKAPEELLVKISVCQKCSGIVRTAVKHMMDTKSKNSFMKEVMESNLSVKEQLLIEYKEENADWCEC